MAMLVKPMGITSKTHQVPASMKRAMDAFPSFDRENALPNGSTASFQGGEKWMKKNKPNPNKIKNILFQSNLILSALFSSAILNLPLDQFSPMASFPPLLLLGSSYIPP